MSTGSRFTGPLGAAVWIAALAVIGVLPAAAQDSMGDGTAEPLTLRGAIERALTQNPDLRGMTYRLQAQQGRISTAALAPPVELRAEVENVAGSGQASGTDLAEATLAISRVIELGGKRTLREAAARLEYDTLALERAAAELDAIAEVTRRFIHVVSDQEQLALTRRAASLAQSTLEAVTRRVEAGRTPDAELNRARIALARARIEEEHAEHELLASRRMLTAMWGATEAPFSRATADLYATPALPAFETFVAQLDRSPDLLRFASVARLREAEHRLASARSRPDLTVSAGVRRLEATDDQAFVVGVSVPLFAGARARGAIEEATALKALTAAEQESRRVRIHAQLYELYQELRHAITEAAMLREEIIPETEAALRNTQFAYERGRYGYRELSEAQRELIEAQRDRIRAAARAHLLRAEIERLTSAPLASATEPTP